MTSIFRGKTWGNALESVKDGVFLEKKDERQSENAT